MATIAPQESERDNSVREVKRFSLDSLEENVVKLRPSIFLVWTTITLFLVAALIVFVILFAIWAVKLQEKEGTEGNIRLNDIGYCGDLKICRRNHDVPPLLIISLDGFRRSYLNYNITPAIQRLMDCGTHSKSMIPTYPSKTFPNHYTMVTGLYPPWSGIVDNNFYDLNFNAYFKKNTNESGWFLGEPIWKTVLKYGLKSAVYFWPGIEASNDGSQDDWKGFVWGQPFMIRVNKVIEWLKRTDNERPAIVQVYFDEPDTAGHVGGPDSDKVRTALILVDGIINYLTNRLVQEGLMGCINLIIISDHGMQQMNLSRSVVVEKHLEKEFDDLFFSGVMARIQTNESAHPPGFDATNALSEMISSMACQHGEDYVVYKKTLMPIRYHYGGSSRIGDIIIKGSPGVCIFLTEEQSKRYTLYGDHGFDNRIISMRAIFIAVGPDFAERKEVENFQNIELYNLFTYLLRIEGAPNNGTNGTLFGVLRNPPPVPETTTGQPIPQCSNLLNIKKCSFSYNCPNMDVIYRKCEEKLHSSINTADLHAFCKLQLCDSIIYIDKKSGETVMVEGIIRRNDWILESSDSCTTYIDGINNSNSCKFSMNQSYTTMSLFANIDRYNTLDLARYIVPETFVNGTWQFFIEEVGEYLAQYGDLAFFSGAVEDKDGDGVPDVHDHQIRSKSPSHIFFVLLRCKSGGAPIRGTLCQDIVFIPFILPVYDENFNCLTGSDYLFDNTARLRDIEMLTGLQFFTDRSIWSASEAIQLRTWLPESLWS